MRPAPRCRSGAADASVPVPFGRGVLYPCRETAPLRALLSRLGGYRGRVADSTDPMVCSLRGNRCRRGDGCRRGMSESMSLIEPVDRTVVPSDRGRIRRSVLDLSVVPDGSTSREALAGTTTLAQRAEELGYDRFWVAEHHNMPTIASTSPPVLIAHLAAVTSRIRVGSGGVMLPNHPPLVVAEQFAMLEAIYPGRVDLGLGRAPGTDPATAAALRRDPRGLGAEDFPAELIDLMGMLGDRRTEHGAWESFRATPVMTSAPAAARQVRRGPRPEHLESAPTAVSRQPVPMLRSAARARTRCGFDSLGAPRPPQP